jgi:VWFA-related protein
MTQGRLFAACVLGLVSSALMVAGAQQPVFRTETNFIEVVASVTNKAGEFVTGLTAADFEIRDQGRTESIDSFSFVQLPNGAARAGAPPVRYRPDMPAEQRAADGRLYLIYLNGATPDNTPLVRRLATEFVKGYLQPGDRAAIWDSQYPLRPVTFTNDAGKLMADIEPYTGVGFDELPFAFRCGTNDERCQAALAEPHNQLTKAIQWFNGIQGRRKSIVLFAGGWLGPNDPVTRSDITLYAVDVRGLIAPDAKTMSSNGQSGAAAAGLVGQNLSMLNESVDGLWTLANRTGGFAIINHNEYQPGFQRIVEANSRYYVLGYASSYKRQDRVYRELDVKVNKPGLKVHARRGYFPRYER